MKLLYDESHNQTWTVDPRLALQLSRRTNEAPRYYSYAHVADLVRASLGGEVVRLTAGPITGEALAGCDVLLLNHCCRRRHEHAGVGGEAVFTAAEIAAVRDAVAAGMGLLVLGEFEIDSWGSNINAILEPFGLRFRNDVATVAAGRLRGPLRLPIFETAEIRPHPAAAGGAADLLLLGLHPGGLRGERRGGGGQRRGRGAPRGRRAGAGPGGRGGRFRPLRPAFPLLQ